MSCRTTKRESSGGGREVPKRKMKNIKREAEEKMSRGAKTGLQRGEAKGGRSGGRRRAVPGLALCLLGQRRLGWALEGLLNPKIFQALGGQGRRLGEGKAGSFTPGCLGGLESLQAGERGALGPFPPLDLLAAGPALPCSQTCLSFPLAYLQASCLPFFPSPLSYPPPSNSQNSLPLCSRKWLVQLCNQIPSISLYTVYVPLPFHWCPSQLGLVTEND